MSPAGTPILTRLRAISPRTPRTSLTPRPPPRTRDATIALPSRPIREGSGGLMPLTDRDRRDILGQARKQLDTGHYPEASYSATTFTPDASGGGAIDGTLTLHGQSRPLQLQVARTGDGQDRAAV